MQTHGAIVVDDGAERVLTEQGKSLLPVGVKRVEGVFTRGDLVAIKNSKGVEIGWLITAVTNRKRLPVNQQVKLIIYWATKITTS